MFPRSPIQLVLALIGLTLTGPASAKQVTAIPGRSIQAAPCTERMGAACWKDAQPLVRFAGDLHQQVREVDVRLAWQGNRLLIRTRGQKAHESVEVIVHRGENNNLKTAQLFVATPGVSSHPLQIPPTDGHVVKVNVLLRNRQDGLTLTWAPSGPGDRSRPATLWFSTKQRTPPTISLSNTPSGLWSIETDDDVQLTVQHRRPIRPIGGKGIPEPWSEKPTPNETFSAPPFTGWYDIEARTNTSSPFGLGTQAVYWDAPITDKLSEHGIHPAPKNLEEHSEPAFSLHSTANICAETNKLKWPQQWFIDEMKRLTGKQLGVSCEAANIHFRLDSDIDLPPQGHQIEVNSGQIILSAASPIGVLYGAMSLADLIGLDGRAPSITIQDWPTVKTRVLFHHAPPNAGTMVRPEDTMDFIERVVARGRYNMLILSLTGAMQLPSRRDLVRRDAWTKQQLNDVLDFAEKYGIEVIPTIGSPSHSAWLVHTYPELSEEGAGDLLCSQNPESRALISDLYNDVFEAFRQPRFIHIGHDEIRFRTHWKHEEQRCARCEGVPRWRLLEEDLLWHHQTVRKLGAKPMLWSDMLVKEWNGSWDGIYRVVNRIPEALRSDFMVISWTRIGDTIGTLVPMGYPVMRGNTGYGDWKRVGLAPIAQGVAGEALALFVPTPWNSMDGSMAGVQLYHHWSNALLAGATAWEPSIEETPIEPSLRALQKHPAYMPGYKAWPKDSKIRPFLGTGETDGPWLLDDTLEVNGVPYSSLAQFAVSKDTHEQFLIGRKLNGLSMLQSVSFPRAAKSRLAYAHRKQPHQQGHPVAIMEITYSDDELLAVPVRLGIHTNESTVPLRGALLWESAGALAVSTSMGEPKTQHLYRVDWHNPHPERVIKSIRFFAKDPAVKWWVTGLATINPPKKKGPDQ